MPLDPREDFQDDGGTPMWRARIEVQNRVRTVQAAPRRRLSFAQQCMLVVFVGGILPWLIIAVGLVGMVIWDHLVGVGTP